MTDLVFLTVIAGFFGLAVLLVRACERIVGSDDLAVTEVHAPEHRVGP